MRHWITSFQLLMGASNMERDLIPGKTLRSRKFLPATAVPGHPSAVLFKGRDLD